MHFVKQVWVGQKGAETRVCAEVDRPSLVFGAREIGGIGITEDPSTQGNKLLRLFLS